MSWARKGAPRQRGVGLRRCLGGRPQGERKWRKARCNRPAFKPEFYLVLDISTVFGVFI